jgi:hypothetical protein
VGPFLSGVLYSSSSFIHVYFVNDIEKIFHNSHFFVRHVISLYIIQKKREKNFIDEATSAKEEKTG